MTDNFDYGQLLRNNGDVVSRLLFKIPTRGNSDEELRGFCVLGSGLRPKVTGGGGREREWGGVGLHSDISSVAVCHYKVYDFVADFPKMVIHFDQT